MSVNKTTYVYKTTQECVIKADIYLCDKKDAPVIVFIHGGALIWGSRQDIKPAQAGMYLEAGFSVVSIDYRLAPETKIDFIVEDVQDAIKWVSSEGKFEHGLNPDRLAVIGNSAGGYLSLVAGTFPSKPKAIVSFYGYGDILGDWYCKPSEFYLKQPEVSRSDAYGSIGSDPLSEGKGNRFKYYLYLRQQGIWTSEVSGYDIVSDRCRLLELCPAYSAKSDYPPTLLLHGDMDTDVPYDQSVIMAQKLTSLNVENRLITLVGKGHAFDYDMNDIHVREAFAEVIKFLKEHLA